MPPKVPPAPFPHYIHVTVQRAGRGVISLFFNQVGGKRGGRVQSRDVVKGFQFNRSRAHFPQNAGVGIGRILSSGEGDTRK